MNSNKESFASKRGKLSDGYFFNSKEQEGNQRVCRILGVEIRVWGADGYRALAREVTSALRAVIKKTQQQLPIALMPDYHPAEFGVVGSVIPSDRFLVPDLIGGDCGCGVYAACTELKREQLAPTQWRELYNRVMARIPVGTVQNREVHETLCELPLWEQIRTLPFVSSHELRKLKHQLGTLGGGNHFIELAADETGAIWILIHSGSRYLGGLLKNYYLGRILPLDSADVEQFFKYQHAILEFARVSRFEMANRVFDCLGQIGVDQGGTAVCEFDLPHNFVEFKTGSGHPVVIHRKGACSAEQGQLGIIPGSMGTGSCIVEGRGFAASYSSSSHGSGRRFSRKEAFRTLSTRDFLNDMKEIVWSGSEKLKDEAPKAYKDLDAVMRSQRDLVRVQHRLTPLLSIKGGV